jgi:hypothetical protein
MKTNFVLSTLLGSTVFALVTGCASSAPVQPAAAPRAERTEAPVKITPPPSEFVEFAVQEKPASKKADKKKDGASDDAVDTSAPAASMRPEKSAQGKLQFQR